MAPIVYSRAKVTTDALTMLHGAYMAQHRRQLSRTEEVSRLAGAILFALLVAFGWWLILKKVVGGDYASVLAVLVTSVCSSALISWRRRRRSSAAKR